MLVNIPGGWMSCCIAVGAVLFFSLILQLIGKSFITRDVLRKRFSIFDLQLAATELEMHNLLNGIVKLGPVPATVVFKKLKMHLWLDFLLMPAVYGALFIAAMQVAARMPYSGMFYFSLLAWLQLVGWGCDILENIFLLKKTGGYAGSNQPANSGFFPAYQRLVAIKWGVLLLALVSVLSSLLYFWVSGNYSSGSLPYVLLLAAETGAFFALKWLLRNAGVARGM